MLDQMTSNRDRRIWALAARRRPEDRRHQYAGAGRRRHEPAGSLAVQVRPGDTSHAMTSARGSRSSFSPRRRSSPSSSSRCRCRSTPGAGSGSHAGRTIPTGSRRRRWTTSCSSSRTPTATARPTSARSSPAISPTRPASSSTTAACSSRSSRTSCSSRTPTATTSTTPSRSCCTASTRPTRITPSTASPSTPAARSTCRKGIFHRTQVETPWGPVNRQVDGGVYRFEPRTWKFETFIPFNFPNPHGHVFDHWARNIVFDATGGQPYYGPSFSTKKYYPAMETRDAPKPGNVRTRPVGGTEILSSRHFPESMQGNLIVLNTIDFRGLLNYKLTEDGAGLKITETDPILHSADPNFRPVDAEVGPDGALYFVDWQNPIVGHMQHNLRDRSRDKLHGRVYRVTAEGRPLLKPPVIAGAPDSAAARLAQGAGEPGALPRADRARRARHEAGHGGAAGMDRQARSEGPGLRASHDGGAVGASVARPRSTRRCSTACCESSEPLGTSGGDAGALLLARPAADPLTLLQAQAIDRASGRSPRSGPRRQLLPGRGGARKSRSPRSNSPRIDS